MPVVPFATGKNKHHPEFGVEGLATEFANGKWIIPSTDGYTPASKELSALVNDLLYYDPNGHTGDHLMAMWFAREGARQKPKGKVRFGRLDTMTR